MRFVYGSASWLCGSLMIALLALAALAVSPQTAFADSDWETECQAYCDGYCTTYYPGMYTLCMAQCIPDCQAYMATLDCLTMCTCEGTILNCDQDMCSGNEGCNIKCKCVDRPNVMGKCDCNEK